MATTRRTAETIQIGDSVKPSGKTEWMVVEAVAHHGDAEYPHYMLLLEDGSTVKAFPRGLIPWRAAAFAA